MTIACPACRADNTERTCRRCRADLGMLFDLEAARERLLAEASRVLATDPKGSLVAAESARSLRDGPDAVRLQACAHLLARDFEAAFHSWSAQQVKLPSGVATSP
jgi:hypothetical protein